MKNCGSDWWSWHGKAAVRIPAAACFAEAERRSGESQAGASSVPGGGVDAAAKEAETLRARGETAAGADGSESGVGAGFYPRRGGVREECLNVSWFQNLFDAKRKIAMWRKE